MKALLLDYTHPLLEEGLIAGGLELARAFEEPLEQLTERHADAEVIIIRYRLKVTKDFLHSFPRLKVIGRLGAGLENIDVEEAARKQIVCLRVPEGNARAVAEHALGMLLGLLNHLPRVQREIKEGKWLRESNKGGELQALKVGVIGCGVMGGTFASLLDAMGVTVLAYDKYKAGYAEGGVQECSLQELYTEADVISVHLPLTAETRDYANADFFHAFKKPIHFINTARGPILNTADLVTALDSGKVLSAGLDVLEYEKSSFTSLFEGPPPPALTALLERENVLLSPHIAGWTKESFEKMGAGLAQKVLAVLKTV